jgi:hypothetical protein
MKLTWTIITTALIFFLMQLALFGLLFSTWFVHLILSVFVCLGSPLKESELQTLLEHILRALMSPVSLILPTSGIGNRSITMPLLLGLDSVFWGIALGTVIYSIWKLTQKSPAVKT